ncbi:MAG TPA: thioredoxin domain-containing protein [Candidatus Paceibacterota bacterium]|nr:thioredoxin domain-containing protein [Candidatus Paceibacterota bacterium]HRZ34194.1 thioredoxin domain-containing protein [Candidatus Paceibacterota bacterium]
MPEEKKNNIWMAISIIIAGALIAAALIFTRGDSTGGSSTNYQMLYSKYVSEVNSRIIGVFKTFFENQETSPIAADITKIPQPNENDHIVGNLNAKVVIVEYSDTECPYCAILHETLKELTEEYGDKIAWIYRPLPLPTLHKKAILEAHAAECVAEIGGNEKFWEYLNTIYNITTSNDGLDINELPRIAESIGIDLEKFDECNVEQRYVSKIEGVYNDVLQATAGNFGTPFSLVVSDGTGQTVSGAQPKEEWQFMINTLLGE